MHLQLPTMYKQTILAMDYHAVESAVFIQRRIAYRGTKMFSQEKEKWNCTFSLTAVNEKSINCYKTDS